MVVATLGRKNRIPAILAAKKWSIYKLHQVINEDVPDGKPRMSYKTVHGIVTGDTIAPQTNYETIVRLADALKVKIDDLEE
jgi:hypothetical protein